MQNAANAIRPPAGRRDWNDVIRDVSAGAWLNPDTGLHAEIPFKTVIIEDSLRGAEADLIARTMPAATYGVVADRDTYDAYGYAIARSLGSRASVIVLDHPHADEGEVRALRDRTRHVDALIAVGSGTINDLCKYATAGDGRQYSVFGTAPSMNGYTSTTASITLDSGLKTTRPAHAAKGVFLDIEVSAGAPQYLIAAGFGDSLCRSTAQVDWYFSHMLLGTEYATSPYVLQTEDEDATMARSEGLGRRDHEAIGYLHRILTLGGFGISITGMSHPGSMGEHQISHWIDSFAGARHPGTVHGQQVGVSSVTMARLQEIILASETAPKVHPTLFDEAAIRSRYPAAAVDECLNASRAKVMDQVRADRFNADLERLWPTLRLRLKDMAVPSATLAGHIRAAGGGATPAEVGMDRDLYRDAVRFSKEMRNRYSMLDLAADMGILEQFIEEEC
ncbi:sn-glycerol-1-phosphate dehydrogenase [Pararhizobium sp.]|uniref:sn-glycerol-1-phosphate dehydrogenase n=1 Tax=Pararhizobium sp. TaxID=1977563 RepID=UPI002719C816|nr:sn-glycerol-1-phosphate dehydrogenase [Pararhizobium sp.]MDO9417605.1 sn-glycerol-1-phosphate dehydrogenase [Pararhizobium sp.]